MGDIADYILDSIFEENEEWEEEGFPHKLDRGKGKCPKCFSETILKHGKYGDFYGCIKFPKCNGSRCL